MTWMTPWMIGGGVSHEVEVARLLAYASTGGAEGIVTPGDLRIRPLSTPGGKIRVAPGAALMLNRFPGGTGQTYVGRLPAQEEVSVTATGSAGGRTDLVVARIHDPQYAGPVPPDPQDFSYARTEVIESVPAGTVSARELNLSYPAVALARIDLPNNTATVEASHITDVREMAQPKTWLVTRPKGSAVADAEILHAVRDGGEWFPNGGGEQKIDIPAEATRMQIRAEWFGLEIGPGNAWGQQWVEFGPGGQDRAYATQRFQWDTANTNNNYREGWTVVDDVYIPEAIRGTAQTFVMKARRNAATGVDKGQVRITALSGTNMEVLFMEVADRSTS